MAGRAYLLLASRRAAASLPSRPSGAREKAETLVPAQSFLGNVWGVRVKLQIPILTALQPRRGCFLVTLNLCQCPWDCCTSLIQYSQEVLGERDSSSAGCARTDLASAASSGSLGVANLPLRHNGWERKAPREACGICCGKKEARFLGQPQSWGRRPAVPRAPRLGRRLPPKPRCSTAFFCSTWWVTSVSPGSWSLGAWAGSRVRPRVRSRRWSRGRWKAAPSRRRWPAWEVRRGGGPLGGLGLGRHRGPLPRRPRAWEARSPWASTLTHPRLVQ